MMCVQIGHFMLDYCLCIMLLKDYASDGNSKNIVMVVLLLYNTQSKDCLLQLLLCAAGRKVTKEDGSGEQLELRLGDLLSFVTGADYPPPLGFASPPEIEFTDDPLHVLPKSSDIIPVFTPC